MTQLLDYASAAAKEAACIVIRDRTWRNSTLVRRRRENGDRVDIGAIESEKCRVRTADEFLRRDNRARDHHHETDQLDQRSQLAFLTLAQLYQAGQKDVDDRLVKDRSTNFPHQQPVLLNVVEGNILGLATTIN
jgi:hypothetical protein